MALTIRFGLARLLHCMDVSALVGTTDGSFLVRKRLKKGGGTFDDEFILTVVFKVCQTLGSHTSFLKLTYALNCWPWAAEIYNNDSLLVAVSHCFPPFVRASVAPGGRGTARPLFSCACIHAVVFSYVCINPLPVINVQS